MSTHVVLQWLLFIQKAHMPPELASHIPQNFFDKLHILHFLHLSSIKSICIIPNCICARTAQEDNIKNITTIYFILESWQNFFTWSNTVPKNLSFWSDTATICFTCERLKTWLSMHGGKNSQLLAVYSNDTCVYTIY